VREIYKRRFCLSDLRSFVRLVGKLYSANIYFCTVEHRVDSPFAAKFVLANFAFAEQRRRRGNIRAVIALTAVCSGAECCASRFSPLSSSLSRARCRPVVNYSVFGDVCQFLMTEIPWV